MNGKTKKVLALLLVLALMTASLTACARPETQSKPEPATDLVDHSILQAASDLLPTHGSTEGKEETVYVIADAQGQPQRAIVSAWLKNPDEAATITDRSDLADIQNVKGDETFTRSENGDLVWDAQGNDIYYQGDSDKELPLAVRVSYKLDGKLVSPEELAGASGHLEMTFRYENKTGREETINGKTVTIYQPFVAVSCLVLDSEKASAVEVTNGTTINSGEQVIVAGLAMPGLKESLGLDELDGADSEKLDEDLPETVTISADVRDFSLLTTVTLVENALLNDVDLENVESFDDLKSSVSKLANASASLVDGAGDLYNGTKALSGGMTKVVNGAAALAGGIGTLQTQMGELDKNLAQLYVSAGDLVSVVKSEGVQGQLEAAQKELNGNAEDAVGALNQLKAGMESLSDALGQVKTQVETFDMSTATATATGALTNIDAAAKNVVDERNDAHGVLDQASSSIQGEINKNATLTEEEKESLCTLVSDELGGVGFALDGIQINVGDDIKTVSDAMAGIQNTIAGEIGGVQKQVDDIERKNIAPAQGLFNQLNGMLTPLADSLGSLQNFNLADSLVKLQGGIGQICEAVDDSLTNEKEGVPALAAGAAALKDGTKSLSDGVNQVANGANALLSGLRTFDGDGVKVLSRLFEEDAQGFMDRLRAVQAYGEEYNSFSGLADGMPGMVRFIIRTDSIGE